ncbi:MAG: HDIG domain-containing protein [Bacteroidales bacterium]|nr:HDIG domain-containing protein [Bacteroidales bacterium]MBR4272965.1 HDIG domain-containing protein [Bacteroidales bacterium]
MKNRKNIPAMVSWLDVLRVSLYVIACVIVLYAIPKEGKFKYEYQKGSPWKHDNLIAPFNFAIYKSQAEIDAEREAVKKDSKPYFTKDNQVQVSRTEKFEADFNAQLAAFGVSDTVAHAKNKELSVFGSLKNVIYKSLSDVYDNGIIENEQFLTNIEGNPKQDLLVAIQNEGITSQKPKSEIITVKDAYLYVKSDIEKFLNRHQGPDAENSTLWKFTNALNPSQWIAPNLEYDQVTTEKVLNDNLESVSLTRGFVQQGQRIIYQGEVVGEEEFCILESLRRDYEQHNSSGYSYVFLGQSILYVMLFALIFMFLRTFRREIFYQTKYSALILSIITFTIVMTSIVIRYNLISIWLLPFLLLAIIIKTFFDTRTGMFLHIVTCVAVSFLMPNSFEYFTMQFIPGYILLMSYEKLNRRSQAFLTSVICFAMYTIIYVSFELMYTGLPNEINWKNLIVLGLNCIMLLMAYPLIYMFEKVFGLLSDVTLLELADSNRPLLRRLAEEAPGTFQHCMQVANLAEAAIFKIGGNPHLARTGALYHDIGKLAAPMYFTENQVSGINPHDQLDYVKSAEIIINHVIKGVAIAKEYNLPMQVVDFIKTHHGTSKAGYFYAMYKKEHPDEDCDKLFTYPGPRPINKEMAVVMMADSIEAASRSLKKYDTESISTLVENIVNSQISNKQFDNTNLTFKDIDTVKSLLKEKLKNIYHARIEYPK